MSRAERRTKDNDEGEAVSLYPIGQFDVEHGGPDSSPETGRTTTLGVFVNRRQIRFFLQNYSTSVSPRIFCSTVSVTLQSDLDAFFFSTVVEILIGTVFTDLRVQIGIESFLNSTRRTERKNFFAGQTNDFGETLRHDGNFDQTGTENHRFEENEEAKGENTHFQIASSIFRFGLDKTEMTSRKSFAE